MIKKSLFLSLALFLSIPSYACKLPQGETITVGCTYRCDFFYRFRLRLAALVTGYPIRFVNMRLFAQLTQAMDSVDAILLPGGADINPDYYLDSVTPELAKYTRENMQLVRHSNEGIYRDGFEHSLIQAYSTDTTFEKLPMLGICRGMQMMSVAHGIPLYLDIKTELGIKNRNNLFDRINLEEGPSLMSELYGNKKFRGFEKHHQGIRMSYYRDHQSDFPLTRVTATSNKGLIAEALEFTHRPALGVQYHPEKSFTRTSFPIFKWFLTKACEYKTTKDKQ
ncbi:MAG TPA: gamma-glutamyl-gamma-aminobutyrate hydrolase family protein [Bacteriovoracaceae bacterium]|nr:gamma-glutamyl-gamma-aminobutyrate hydrolase family protein [Bacteriovoracaceae bacterium]